MSVRKEKRRNPKTGEVWEKYRVDVAVTMPDRRTKRVNRDAPVQTKRDAEMFEQELRRSILDGTFGQKGGEACSDARRVREGVHLDYAESNNKKSEVQTKEGVFKNHLFPAFGTKRLKEIGAREIEAFKSPKLREAKSAKTVNNTLTVLRKTLSVAHEWGVIPFVPNVTWLKVQPSKFDFLAFDEAERPLRQLKLSQRKRHSKFKQVAVRKLPASTAARCLRHVGLDQPFSHR
jgi:hypothetical protein